MRPKDSLGLRVQGQPREQRETPVSRVEDLLDLFYRFIIPLEVEYFPYPIANITVYSCPLLPSRRCHGLVGNARRLPGVGRVTLGTTGNGDCGQGNGVEFPAQRWKGLRPSVAGAIQTP